MLANAYTKEINKQQNEILASVLWHNPDISDTPLFFLNWYKHGITYVADILGSNGSILSQHELEQKYALKINFIALIHPIQWTIAYPVGADRPAKRQKKTSCVSTGQAGPVLCTRQVACSTSFLSRQRDVIASFSFGACLCARNIFIRSLSSVFHCYW